MSRKWADLVKRARSKQLQPVEFNSGTFTISNLVREREGDKHTMQCNAIPSSCAFAFT